MPVIHHTAPTGAPHGASPRPGLFAALLARSALGGLAAASALLLALALALAALAALAAPARALVLAAYAAAELLFALHFRRRLARLSAIPERHAPEGAEADGPVVFERFLRAAARMAAQNGGHVERLIARWCRAGGDGADLGSNSKECLARTSSSLLAGVTRGNAAEMLAYGFFYRPHAAMRGAADAMARRLEQAWGREFAPGGANPELRLMEHLNEPVRAAWRPLAFYLGTEAVALVKHCALLASGWRCAAPLGAGGPTFYTFGLPPPPGGGGGGGGNNKPSKTPILFCHGVGLGLAPYVPMIQRLAAAGRPVVAVEFKHLAMRWTSRVPTVEQAAEQLASVLSHLSVSRADVVGHSFGTFFLSRLLKTRPDLVRTVSLLDPVCCCMWTGDLVARFVYQPHRSSTGPVTWLIARDLHAAVSVSRRFYWSDYNLWPEDVAALARSGGGGGGGGKKNKKARVLLAVGGRDDLVPAAHVAATLACEDGGEQGGGLTMLLDETRKHADVVLRMSWQRRALDEALAQMSAADAEEAAEAEEAEEEEAAVAAEATCLSSPVAAPVALAAATEEEEEDDEAVAVDARVTIDSGSRPLAVKPLATARTTPPPLRPSVAALAEARGGGGGEEQEDDDDWMAPPGTPSRKAPSRLFLRRSYTVAAGVAVPRRPRHARTDSDDEEEQGRRARAALISPASSAGLDDVASSRLLLTTLLRRRDSSSQPRCCKEAAAPTAFGAAAFASSVAA